LNLPIPAIESIQQGACMTINAEHDGNYEVKGIEEALQINGVALHLFGKETAYKGRRLGIILAPTEQIAEEALRRITIEKT
jgi:formate-dependent phosphoribosylglycinamide formyltransferase (GAR transformylase)